MIQLSQITDIFLIVFCLFYIVGTFWKPLIIRKKSLIKKIIAKQKINQISMEFDQMLLKFQVEEAEGDLRDLQKQITDLHTLKDEKVKELAELKEKTGETEKWVAKQKEIDDIDVQATNLLEEEKTANQIIKMGKMKVMEYTKQLSLNEQALNTGKKLAKDL